MATPPSAPRITAQFAAIDLDAVLDDFESQQAQQATPPAPTLDTPPSPGPPPLRLGQEPAQLSPSPPESMPPKFERARAPAHACPTSPAPSDSPPTPMAEALAVVDTLDVATSFQETEDPAAEPPGPENGDLTSGSSSPSFHSIYDRSVSPSAGASGALDLASDSRATEPEPEPAGADGVVGGTRPKAISPTLSAPSPPLIPVLVSIPPESPPPYSEVDPMHDSQVLRPMRPQDLPIVNAHLPDEGLDEGFDEEPQLEVPPAPVVLFPPPVAEEPAEPPEPADYLEPMIPSRNPPLAHNLEVPPPGAPGSTPNHPTDPSIDLILQGLTEAQLKLGSEAPTWVPDEEASQCMICAAKFTLVRRRHHCRACGKLLCSACCGEKAVLLHLDSKLGRVCKPCHSIMDRLDRHARLKSEGQSESSPGSSLPAQPRAPPNPNNPMEYCSTVPPLEQARSSSSGAGPSETPSVMVPVGVLKRNSTSGSANAANAANGSTHPTSPETNPRAVNGELKHVMFSDGIRPGGDLTEVDGSSGSPSLGSSGGLRRPPMSGKSRSKSSGKSSGRKSRSTADVGRSLLPEDSDQLPFIRHPGDPRPAFGDVNELAMAFLPSTPAVNPNHEEGAVASPSTLEQDPHTVQFVLNKNLIVHVKSVFYEPVGRTIWNFRSQGLASVGQDEVVFLLIRNEDECLPPRDIFDQIQSIYEAARGGNPVTNLGYTTILSGKPFLDSTDYGGFLYIKPTFQSRSGLDLPQHSPYLFGVLISKWEVSWARVFPLRLKLRLGAQAKYYPAPIWSDRDRTTAYRDVGNTIMKLLSDFRNFTYTLPVIKGMMIHSEEKLTTIIIPKDRYRQIQRALLNSNDPVLALGAIFSPKADSHLVAVHSDDTDKDGATRNLMSTSDYETRTINSLNGQRKVTGASFIVFNGALKSASGLRGKSSIVEDGIMVQVSQERMLEFRKSLERMEDVEIECGPVGEGAPEEKVLIQWVNVDETVNSGQRSLIDSRPFDGFASIRLHAGRDFVSDKSHHFIRWTEVFLLSPPVSYDMDPSDPMNVATTLAKAVCVTLAPHLKYMLAERQSPLAVRVNLETENFGYEAGSNGQPFSQEFMNFLDDSLIPLLHGGDLVAGSGRPSLEMVFHILDC